jgi:hypothetical protein
VELPETQDIGEVIGYVAEALADKKAQERDEKMTARLAAVEAEQKNLRNATAGQPDRLPPGQGGTHRLTREDIAKMSPEEYAKRRPEIIAALSKK